MSASRSFIHPVALAALDEAIKHANLSPVIVQTKGDAPQSKGTHDTAGYYIDSQGKKRPYSPCIDFSVRQLATRLTDRKKLQMDEAHIKWFLQNLSEQGIAGWYRTPSQGFDSPHIHVVTPMVPISLPIVQRQVRDFVTDRTGLASHGPEHFWTASAANDAKIKAAFLKANPQCKELF